MMKYKVVLVPFPVDDLSSNKVRPAVCLTEPIGPHRHIILAFITSRIPVIPLATDIVIDSHDPDFALTGLHVSSTLQLHRLMTATTTLIRRKLGQLPPKIQTQVKQRLHKLFDLA
jgi:mRNA interferase MazF